MGNREALVAIAAVFMVIPIIAVAMRMSSRRMQRAGFAADDLVIVFALVRRANGPRAMSRVYSHGPVLRRHDVRLCDHRCVSSSVPLSQRY